MGESMEKVGKRTDRIKMDVILAAGCMLRLFYVLFSTIYDRQYDIGMIDLDAGHTVTGGHLAYIQYLYENWKLPDFDPTSVYQFNHPPLHHYLCALWMKLCSLFISNTDVLEESIQIVPFVCSLLILWFLLRIAEQFELTEKAKRFVLLLCYRRAAAPCTARELIGRELPCRPHQVLRVTVQPCTVRIFFHPCKILGLVFFINKLAEPSCQNPLKSGHVVSIRFVVHDAVFIQVFHCIIRCQNRIFYIFLFTGKLM